MREMDLDIAEIPASSRVATKDRQVFERAVGNGDLVPQGFTVGEYLIAEYLHCPGLDAILRNAVVIGLSFALLRGSSRNFCADEDGLVSKNGVADLHDVVGCGGDEVRRLGDVHQCGTQLNSDTGPVKDAYGVLGAFNVQKVVVCVARLILRYVS